MIRLNHGSLATLAAGIFAMGCSGEPGDPAPEPQDPAVPAVENVGTREVAGRLLAEVRYSATHHVEFREIEPGFVGVLEQFNVDHDQPLNLAGLKAEKVKLADVYIEAVGSGKIDSVAFESVQAADQRLGTAVRPHPVRPDVGNVGVEPRVPDEPMPDTTLVPKSPNCSADSSWFTGYINSTTIGGRFTRRNDCRRGTLATPGDFWFTRFQGYGFNQNEIFDPFRVVTFQVQQRVCVFSFGICFDHEWRDLARIPLATRTANNAWFFVSSGSFEARNRIVGEGGSAFPGAVWSQQGNGWL